MRSEVVSCWISDVSEACAQLPTTDLDTFVWKPSANQQTQADATLTSLVWHHRPPRGGNGNSNGNGNGNSNGNDEGPGASITAANGNTNSAKLESKLEVLSTSTGITPDHQPLHRGPSPGPGPGSNLRHSSPDPNIFNTDDPAIGIGIATISSIVTPTNTLTRALSSRALRQKPSQSSIALSKAAGASGVGLRGQSAVLSALRKEFINHEELQRRGSPSPGSAGRQEEPAGVKPRPIPPRLYASLHGGGDDSGNGGGGGISGKISGHLAVGGSSVGNAHSMGTLLDLASDDSNSGDFYRTHKPTSRSIANSPQSNSLIYSHNYANPDNLSRSYHAASSEALAPTRYAPSYSPAPGAPRHPATLAAKTAAVSRPHIRTPTPDPTLPFRPIPLRTVLETLDKPLRWDDSTHDIRLRCRALTTTSSRFHPLSELVKAIIASSGDYHTCKLPQEVAPLFASDDDVPPDAFASAPFDALEALPGLEEALRIHVAHNSYAHSMVSLQTAAAMAILQHAHITDIVSATHRCRDADAAPPAWSDTVHAPLLHLTARSLAALHPENTTAATLLPHLVPAALSHAAPMSSEHTPLMIDYALTLSLSQLATATGNQLHRELLALLRRRTSPDSASINHTLYGPLTKAPIACFVRTAAPLVHPGSLPIPSPQSTAAHTTAALAQLCLSATAWYRHIESFCECTFKTECCSGPPFMPLLRVAGDAWTVVFVVNSGEEFEVLPSVNIGSTETVTGCYRLLESLRHIVEWIQGDYLDWFTEFLSHHS